MFLSLFISSFLAATIIPFASEVYFAGVLYMGYDPLTTVLVATAGNWLGGLTNYFIGMLANIERIKKWTGVKQEKINKLETTIHQYGYWSALLSWVPVIGDPLMVVLGIFKSNWKMVFMLSLIGKFLRYLVLGWVLVKF